MDTLQLATLLGARILEKHFTHDKSLPGNDHYHAMDHVDVKDLNQSYEIEWSWLDYNRNAWNQSN